MMKKLLVFGMKEPAGGVETAVMAYLRKFDENLITADAAVFEDNFSYKQEIESRGGKVHVLPVRRADPKAYNAAVEKLFNENRYDAVWCNFSGLTNIDFLKLAKKHGIKIRVAHSHTNALSWGSPVMKYAVTALHEKNKLSIGKYTTHFFGCSRRSAKFMYGDKTGSTATVIPNAIDTKKFLFSQENRQAVREETGIPENAFVLGHVGRMCYPKNQTFLIDIFDKLCEKQPDARLLFVGDGELKQQVLDHAKQKKCFDKIVFTGSRTDTNRLYSAMDVFCLPSHNEGFPVTLVEAQAAEIPCAVSTEAVDRDADICGNMSFLSTADSPEKWADEILRLYKEKKPAKTTVSETVYDIDTAAKKLQDFFTKD